MNNYGQPYFVNPGVPYGYSPAFQNIPAQPQMQKNQQPEQYAQPQPQPVQQPYKQQMLFLQGKSVDSVEVVKAMDIPLDGTVSYFPLTDGTAIVTKQLQQDGTSKTIVYKPIVEEEKPKEEIKYVTQDELTKAINSIDLSEIEEIMEEFKDFKKELKDIKSKLKSKGD